MDKEDILKKLETFLEGWTYVYPAEIAENLIGDYAGNDTTKDGLLREIREIVSELNSFTSALEKLTEEK